jgi:hypothetical protein
MSWLKRIIGSASVALMFSCSCLAAGDFMGNATSEEPHEQSWKREQKLRSKPDSLAIIQQRAQARAEQRQTRMATLAWYGISNSRPGATSTPFTSRYGSAWEMPGGQPYSWYPGYTQPTYVLLW